MKATFQFINKELSGYYPEKEIQSFIRLIIEHVCQLSYTEIILKKDEILDPAVRRKVEKIIARLKRSEPIQYILGETEFSGIRLKVTSAVLIPRPETEELVHWVIEQNKLTSPYVLDIGTGSGCIALAIKNQINKAKVSAVDSSQEALKIAQMNASTLDLSIGLIRANILSFESYDWEEYDLIISNPPYVRELEKKQMDNNVLQYEPEGALFVSDKDPLIFYRAIAEFSEKYLKNNGLLFVEINEELGKQITTLFQNFNFVNIELKKDINGKDRFLKCTKQ